MASTAGLSRRRVAQTSQSEDGTTTTTQKTSPTSSSTNLASNRAQHAGTAFEGGAQVAYDPRDLEREDEAKKLPRLTLLEEIVLLGIKDRAVRTD